MKARLLLGLWVLLGVVRSENCTATNYKNYYFTWCLNDGVCKGNLNLAVDDFWSFSNLLAGEMLPRMGMTGADMCDDGERFWKAYLRSIDVCQPNYYRNSNNQCVLRAGKVEEMGVEHHSDFEGLLSPVMYVLVALVVCWWAMKDIQAWEEIRRTWNGATSNSKFT